MPKYIGGNYYPPQNYKEDDEFITNYLISELKKRGFNECYVKIFYPNKIETLNNVGFSGRWKTKTRIVENKAFKELFFRVSW